MNQEQFTELVLQIQDGDSAAMEELLLQAHTPVSYLTNKILQNPKAAQLVTKEAIYVEAKKRSEELVSQTQNRINQLRKAANEYMDESLRQTEEVISNALNEVRDTRMKFRAVKEAQEQRKNANVDVEV